MSSAASASSLRFGILADRDFLEVRFGGTGGQGVILMGVTLAMAATRDHRQVVQTQSYGPEARGGYSRSDVIISDRPIDYPQLSAVDLLVCLSQEAAGSYAKALRPAGVFIYDSEKVTEPPKVNGQSYGVPFTRLAVEQIGKEQTANMLTLGAVVGITGVVSPESLRKAMLEMVPRGTQDLNAKALALGLSLYPGDWLSTSAT